ncbi:MAG TPA: hypothetical protein VN041_02970 [Microbacterium sp.]|nr:hypothetical protein [Microbacterium sp.]
MGAPLHNANGHRRRQVVARVKAEEHDCALCDQHVDKTLNFITGGHGKKCPSRDCTGCMPDPMRGEVDEDVPRSRGGSPYDRGNTHLMHRKCNQFKSDMTIAEAREKLHGAKTTTRTVTASPIW